MRLGDPREHSLESGLKYLIIGSVGSATLLYGFALLYGAPGSTDFAAIADSLGRGGQADDSLVLLGTRDGRRGLAFKALAGARSTSGRPTSTRGRRPRSPRSWRSPPRPRPSWRWRGCSRSRWGRVADDWQPALAALAVISIVVGNVGALGQDSLKRLLGYSGIAQAGYMLAGIVVATQTGLEALVFYLAAYCLMNLAVFVVIDDPRARDGGATTSAR